MRRPFASCRSWRGPRAGVRGRAHYSSLSVARLIIMNLSPLPVQKFFTNNGNPLVGGLLFTYAAGTTTKIATYQDSAGGASNTNPIVLDFRGECRLWLDPA